jgi:hypothetical protein
MTQQEIQERNIQIALMLGWTYNNVMERWNEDMLHEYSYIEALKFHSDWNWLMEAVEFIRLKNWSYDMYCPSSINEKDSDGEFECNFWDKINPEVIGRSKTSLKEAVFLAVSDFAKLYNNNKL